MTTTPERPIVAAIDFSPASNRALEWAVELARLHRARLLLVHAVPHLDAIGPDVLVNPELPDRVLLEARRALEGLARSLRPGVPQVSWEVRHAPVSRCLADVASATKAQLLVMGTRGLRGWRHALLGSNVERVIGLAACPVLAVHAEDPPPPEPPWTLLFATDFSADADHALEAVLGCCADRVGEVAVVHSFALPPVIPASEMATWALYDGLRRDRARQLDRTAAAIAATGVATSAFLRDGDVPLVVSQAVAELGADVVVMGSRGHGGVAQLLVGSNAARVTQLSTRPVLVVPRRAWSATLALESDVAAAAVDEQC